MLDVLVPALTFLALAAIGGAIATARSSQRKVHRARLREGVAKPAKRETSTNWLVDVLRRLGGLATMGGASTSLKQALAHAGYHGSSAPSIYMGTKMLLLLVGVTAAGAALMPLRLSLTASLLLATLGGIAMSFVPNMVVHLRRRKRCAEVRSNLPDAIDLLEICVSSGMGLDMAWNSVTDEVRHVSQILADEMALTSLEMRLGLPRAEAMRHMAERTGAAELSSLVAMLVQSERFGTKMADALRTFAESMRENRSLRAQEAAEKMAVKLLFPMVLFIFPAVIIVIAGSAGLKLYKMITTY